MKFLIDGSERRIKQRKTQAPELIQGQLLTPLTRYRKCEKDFAVDNGAFSGLDLKGFSAILRNNYEYRDDCLFVAIPDVVADHTKTLSMWNEYQHLADGYRKAFVVQDGFDGWPDNADAVFIGGSTEFKDSYECQNIVLAAIKSGLHVHIGRVNTFYRFYHFHMLGANTCDGSGVSMYDHMIEKINLYLRTGQVVTQMHLELDIKEACE